MRIETFIRPVVCAGIVIVSIAAVSAAPKHPVGTKTIGAASFLGSVSPGKAGPSATTDGGFEFRESPEQEVGFDRQISGAVSPARLPAAHIPKPAASAVAGPVAGFGFNGLTQRDQRLASAGNKFSIEPPDQGLAVGNGFVVEAVNTALRVRMASDGSVVLPTVGLNDFFGLPPEIIRSGRPCDRCTKAARRCSDRSPPIQGATTIRRPNDSSSLC